MIGYASEIGISHTHFQNITWKEFDYYSKGYERKLERGWDYARHVMSSMFNSSGFSKKKVFARDIMKLNILDRVGALKEVDRVKPSEKAFLIEAYKRMSNGRNI